MITSLNHTENRHLIILLLLPILLGILLLSGCVSGEVDFDQPTLINYQEHLVKKAPENDLVQHLKSDGVTASVTTNGVNTIKLTLEDAVSRVLANNPEISVVSFDPAIAKEEVTQAAAAFDPELFSEFNYDDQDDPTDSIFLGGESTSRLFEAGIRQKGTTGAEWSLGYALTHASDDLTTRTLPTRYETVATLQIRQPLLRDGWKTVNLAGVNVSKLNYKVALLSFQQQAEAVSAEVISLYWRLKQIRMDRHLQQKLLAETQKTLERVQDRKDIDASMAQIKQAETSFKRREAFLYDIEKELADVQDQLIRLLADSGTNLRHDQEIIPTAEFTTQETIFDQSDLLRTARKKNPAVLRSNLAVEIAQINIDVAKHQKMPKLDLVASTRLSGLDESYSGAQDVLRDGDYSSYAVGVTFEISLDNRLREAEYRKRMMERSRAKSQQWNVLDQVMEAVKEAVRSAETAFEQTRIQHETMEAASAYLQALEDTETIRKQLTPEFLLLKLQAQEALAEASRGEIKALADYNIALIRLAQSTGTVLDVEYVKEGLPKLSPSTDDDEPNKGFRIPRLRE